MIDTKKTTLLGQPIQLEDLDHFVRDCILQGFTKVSSMTLQEIQQEILLPRHVALCAEKLNQKDIATHIPLPGERADDCTEDEQNSGGFNSPVHTICTAEIETTSCTTTSSSSATAPLFSSMYMICYSPLMTLQNLIQALENFVLASQKMPSFPDSIVPMPMTSKKIVSFWIDIFSTPIECQVKDKLRMYEDVTKFCGDKLVLISPWQHAEVFSNPISLYQLFMATSSLNKGWTVAMSNEEQKTFSTRVIKRSIDTEKVLLRKIDLRNISIGHKVQRSDLKASNDSKYNEDHEHEDEFLAKQIQNLLGLNESMAVEDQVHHSICHSVKRWLLEDMQRGVEQFTPVQDSTKSYSTIGHQDWNHRKFEEMDGGETISDISFQYDGIEAYLIHCIGEETEALNMSKEMNNNADRSSNTTSSSMASQATPLVSHHVTDATYLISFLASLGDLYIVQKRLNDAEAVYLKMLELQQHELGPCNLATLNTTLKIADIFAACRKYSMAELFFTSYLKGLQECGRASARDMLLASQHVANFFYTQSSFDKAEYLYTTCYQQALTLHGMKHHITLHTASMLANVKQQLRKHTEAIQLAKECIQIAKFLHPMNSSLIQQYEVFYQTAIMFAREDYQSESKHEEPKLLHQSQLLPMVSVEPYELSFNTNVSEYRQPSPSPVIESNIHTSPTSKSTACVIC